MLRQQGELKRVLGLKDLFAQAAGHIIGVGVMNEEFGSGATHHNEKFDTDESGLWLGVAAEPAFVAMP